MRWERGARGAKAGIASASGTEELFWNRGSRRARPRPNGNILPPGQIPQPAGLLSKPSLNLRPSTRAKAWLERTSKFPDHTVEFNLESSLAADDT
jgi:hypothetical protein